MNLSIFIFLVLLNCNINFMSFHTTFNLLVWFGLVWFGLVWVVVSHVINEKDASVLYIVFCFGAMHF